MTKWTGLQTWILAGLVLLLSSCTYSRAELRLGSLEKLSPTQRKQVETLLGQVKTSVVELRHHQFRGSGVLVDPRGLVLTCNHVLAMFGRRRGPEVRLADGRTFPSQILLRNYPNDIAILKVEAKKPLPYLEIGPSPTIGSVVMALGQKGGVVHYSAGKIYFRHLNLAPPIIEFKQGERDYFFHRALIHGAPVFPGDSGGPVVDMKGRLVGINLVSAQMGSRPIFLAFPALPWKKHRDFLVQFQNEKTWRDRILAILEKSHEQKKLTPAERKELVELKKMYNLAKAVEGETFQDTLKMVAAGMERNGQELEPEIKQEITDLAEKLYREGLERHQKKGETKEAVLRWVWQEFWRKVQKLREKSKE